MLGIARVSAVLVLLGLTASARAASTSFTFLVDSDANAATGCSVAVPGGTVSGIELRLTVPVTTTTTAGTVGALSVQTCVAGIFGAAVPVDSGGWPVGVGLGVSASDVVEAYLPLSLLSGSSSARVAVVSSSEILGPFTVALGPAPVPANVPTLSPLALGILALGLALFGLRFLKGGSGAGALFLVLLAGGGIAWAAVRAHDGNPSDWAGVPPLGTDPVGDAPAGADLVALFARVDGANLELRVDARLAFDAAAGNQPPVVNAGADLAVTLPAPAALSGSALDDGLPVPPGALTFSWSQVSGPGTTTFGTPSAAATSASFSTAGIYLLRLTASDGALSGSDTVQVTAGTGTTPTGVLLEGASGAPAVDATTDLLFFEGVPPGEISVDADGLDVARTMIEIAFNVDATVGDLNALIQSIGARIVSMLDGVAILTVRFPDPGSLAGLDAIVAQVEASPIVRHVNRAYFDLADELPSNYTPSSTDLPKIDHNLAIRAHAAWNARAALAGVSATRPLVIVSDDFGNGAPASDFDVNDTDGDYGQTNPSEHGYHVLGIISATFGGGLTPGNLATGIYPATAVSRAVDRNFTFTSPSPAVQDRMIGMIKGSPFARIVLNTSFGHDCRTPAKVSRNCSVTNATRGALDWIEKVRGSTAAGPNLEGKFVHASSAGNVYVATDLNAALASGFNASRLLQSLTAPGGGAVANLSNVLVVENRRNSATTPFQPGCLASGSKVLGSISAIGTDVWSLDTAVGDLFASNKSGTSMSSPQVAGLAAYVWALDPSLSNTGVVDVLKTTARSPAGDTGCSIAPSQVVDAYAAVLAADRGFLQSPARRAILDAADGSGSPGSNGQFDEKDVELFLSRFGSAAGAVDYSRFDLNGDGRTGGTTRETFDLDINRPVILGNVNQSIEGSTIAFNEERITDLDVLCYYAYSSIFTPVDPAERGRLLGARCAPSVTVSPASVNLAQGATQQFTATVTGATSQAVTWTATGGTITPGGLYTAPSVNGTHTVTARSVEVPTATGSATVVVATPAPIRAGYDGTATSQELGCEPDCVPQVGTERWLMEQRTATEFFLFRTVPPPGPCLIVGSASCTPAFQITGGSFQATSTAGNTVTGSVGNGQLHFVYDYLCATNSGLATCRETFDGIYPIQVTPASLDFGTVMVGQSSTQIVTITNTGPLPVSGGFDSFPTGSPFTVINNSNCLVSLAGGATCQVSVRFAPIGVATFTHTLVIQTQVNLTGGDQVSLRGVGN